MKALTPPKIVLLISVIISSAMAPLPKMTAEEYIEKFKADAITQMKEHGIPASITLAQGMLESGNGNSDLAVIANNHFGIKCHNDWKGETYIMDDDKKDECFRKYKSVNDSYHDHAMFLTKRSNYAKLFELKTTDYKAWAKGLKEAGYATDPKYPERLITIIEKYELYQYDSPAKKSKNKENNRKEKPTHTPSKTLPQQQHEIARVGIRKYIIVKEGDTFYSIAKEFDKDLWQLYKYNDLTEKDKLNNNDIIYLQPKKNKGKKSIHIVQQGETMRSISQTECIKLKMLYYRNDIKEGVEPNVGDTLLLRRYK